MDYFQHPGISNTKLGWFKKSPAHFKYFQENPQKEKESYLIGSVAHCHLFEPHLLKKLYHVFDESLRPEPNSTFNNKKNKEWRDEIFEAYKGKKFISKDNYDEVCRMMDAIAEHEAVQDLLKGCEFEKEVYWTDPNTGLSCKKKVDGECSTHRIDYKTAENSHPFEWPKKAWKYEYYRQAGFYDMDSPKEFYFIVQEKTAPYNISIHRCTNELLDYGKNEANSLLARIKAHMDIDIWPGYETHNYVQKAGQSTREQQIFDFDIPAWVLQNM